MSTQAAHSTAFGRQLRDWRKLRGLSQLQLAALADTTPRHVSFIETGRSRPGRAVILRIADSLDLPPRECNALLEAAGFPHAHAERPLDDAAMKPVLDTVRRLLDAHSPYPAAAIDESGRIHLCNATYERLLPDALSRCPTELIDSFYGAPGRAAIENWEQVAWVMVERRRKRAERSGDPQLAALAERALAWMKDVPRPAFDPGDESPLTVTRYRFEDRVIATHNAVLRFETAREVTASELRVELVYPLDDQGDSFFRSLASESTPVDDATEAG